MKVRVRDCVRVKIRIWFVIGIRQVYGAGLELE
jgi:hypothetical protein